jgi:plastocyanin
VTWTWEVNAEHNVTFEDGNQSSPTQSSGDHQRNFPNAGSFRYRCTLHSADFASGMSGRIVVQ